MSDQVIPAVPESETTPATTQPKTEAATADAAGADVMVVVASKVKSVIKGKGLRMDGNFAEALNAKVVALVEKAAEHAKADSRATVRPFDLEA